MDLYKKSDVDEILSSMERCSMDFILCEDKKSYGNGSIEMTDEVVKSFHDLHRGRLRCVEGIRSLLKTRKIVACDGLVE